MTNLDVRVSTATASVSRGDPTTRSPDGALAVPTTKAETPSPERRKLGPSTRGARRPELRALAACATGPSPTGCEGARPWTLVAQGGTLRKLVHGGEPPQPAADRHEGTPS